MNTYQTILNRAKEYNAELVVVSKTRTNEEIMGIYNQGHRTFGENRVNDLMVKMGELPDDINWHFIGHLQTKKIKSIIDKVELIHSVDSLHLLAKINRMAKARDLKVNCLLQIKIAQEESKYGFSIAEINQLITDRALDQFHHISFGGLMGMATFTDDEDQIRSEFKTLKKCFDNLKEHFIPSHPFQTISMGMSGDYEVALSEGSTMLRIGSLLFNPTPTSGASLH